MARTRNRPLPSGRISKDRALLVAGTFWTVPFFTYSAFQPYTLWVAMSVWSGYAFLYTPLKQRTSYNTAVGALVGALPPLIGSFAQLGQLYQPEPLLLCAYILAWQFPHFYGILYQHKDDYSKADFVMISDEDPDGRRASKHMFLAHLAMQGAALGLYSYGALPIWALAINAYGQAKGVRELRNFWRNPDEKNAKRVKNSVYLPFLGVLAGLLGEAARRRLRGGKEEASPAPSE